MATHLHPYASRSYGNARLTMEPPPQYPGALIMLTNRCNLKCTYCSAYQDGNPTDIRKDWDEDALLAELERLRDRHGFYFMLWMGGEPMLRWKTVAKGVGLFRKNVITTNGTLKLRPFPANVQYVVSLDGPEEINDRYRGKGIFEKVMARIAALPDDFPNTVQVHCVVHEGNQEHLAGFVAGLRETKVDGVTFTFLSPSLHDDSDWGWKDLGEREKAIDIVLSLKSEYPGFVWNSARAMELMRANTAKLVTDNCPLLKNVLPLFIERDHFVTPFCCMGDVADCDRCGQWGVFAQAAKMAGPWDALLPQTRPYDDFSLL